METHLLRGSADARDVDRRHPQHHANDVPLGTHSSLCASNTISCRQFSLKLRVHLEEPVTSHCH